MSERQAEMPYVVTEGEWWLTRLVTDEGYLGGMLTQFSTTLTQDNVQGRFEKMDPVFKRALRELNGHAPDADRQRRRGMRAEQLLECAWQHFIRCNCADLFSLWRCRKKCLHYRVAHFLDCGGSWEDL